jgi:hypothetical protein
MKNFILSVLVKIFIFKINVVILAKITMIFSHFMTLIAKDSILMMMCGMCVMRKRDA